MLLDFRVRNFRSFREEAVLSLAASPDTALEETHTRATGMDKVKRVLNTAALYGANASGKSNLLRALQFMQAMVMTSNQIQPDQEHSAMAPFLLRPDAKDQPSLFEATFLIGGRRFQYGFEMTSRQVLEEWLLVYEKAKPQVWFNRTFDPKKGKYAFTFSDYFTGSKKLWEQATRKEVLFLTNAVQLNSDMLRPLYQKFSDEMAIFPFGPDVGYEFTAGFSEDSRNKKKVVSLIAAADTGISGFSLESRQARQVSFSFPAGTPEVRDAEMMIPKFGHRAGGELYEFDHAEESAGTQILFGLAGPVLDILEKGRLLIIDELDRSLHPLLVHKIVQMFNDPELNKKGAQLIFSTHDVSLLDGNKLRRDQIWFTEKDNEHVSHLFPLLDFSPRKGEALEKGYLGGRYGGIPILGEVES